MLPDYLEESRRHLMKLLADLRQRHEVEMKPIIDQLVRIECMRPAPRIVVTEELAEKIKLAEMDVTKRPITTVYCGFNGGQCALCPPRTCLHFKQGNNLAKPAGANAGTTGAQPHEL